MKGCPWCDSEDIVRQTVDEIDDGEFLYTMECIDCGARGPTDKDIDEAERLWNERANFP